MKKQNPLILTIPNPCHENWAEMTVVDKGRFCSHCQKTVTDLTGMSDTAILQFFQQQTDRHCIRAFSTQLNRPITLAPQAPTRFYRIAVALGLTIMMAGAAEAYARPKAPLVEQRYLFLNEGINKEGTKDSSCISGKLIDINDQAVSNAVVNLYDSRHKVTTVVSDTNGNFILSIWNNTAKDHNYYLIVRKENFANQSLDLSSEIIESGYALTIKMLAGRSIGENENQILMGD